MISLLTHVMCSKDDNYHNIDIMLMSHVDTKLIADVVLKTYIVMKAENFQRKY